MKAALLLASATLLVLSGSASAQVRLEGYLIALSDCGANKKKDSDNPGNVRLEVMHAYEMLAKNAEPGTHYQVKVPGAPQTEARWVPMSCGAYAPKTSLVVAGGGAPPADGDGSGGGTPPRRGSGLPPDGIEYVLAASWQPAFCAGHADKDECRTQTADRFDATHFALHGLWPDDLDDKKIYPCYCDRGTPRSCDRTLSRDESINLSPAVMDKLKVIMPGTQSGLELHEWPKHGSCYEDDKTGGDAGADPDEYFSEAMALMAKLNESSLQPLFESHIGSSLTRGEIEAAFDTAFGAGASDRLIIKCSGGAISELWIGLKGDVTSTPDLKALIQAAPTTATSTNDRSCKGGKVLAALH